MIYYILLIMSLDKSQIRREKLKKFQIKNKDKQISWKNLPREKSIVIINFSGRDGINSFICYIIYVMSYLGVFYGCIT